MKRQASFSSWISAKSFTSSSSVSSSPSSSLEIPSSSSCGSSSAVIASEQADSCSLNLSSSESSSYRCASIRSTRSLKNLFSGSRPTLSMEYCRRRFTGSTENFSCHPGYFYPSAHLGSSPRSGKSSPVLLQAFRRCGTIYPMRTSVSSSEFFSPSAEREFLKSYRHHQCPKSYQVYLSNACQQLEL